MLILIGQVCIIGRYYKLPNQSINNQLSLTKYYVNTEAVSKTNVDVDELIGCRIIWIGFESGKARQKAGWVLGTRTEPFPSKNR